MSIITNYDDYKELWAKMTKIWINRLDPNNYTEDVIEKISEIYGKTKDNITYNDFTYIELIYLEHLKQTDAD